MRVGALVPASAVERDRAMQTGMLGGGGHCGRPAQCCAGDVDPSDCLAVACPDPALSPGPGSSGPVRSTANAAGMPSLGVFMALEVASPTNAMTDVFGPEPLVGLRQG